MTSRECFENKWFYMKYIGKYLSVEILLALECICINDNTYGGIFISIMHQLPIKYQ
jgi:branched-subunit amino acid transport protein AzlD